MLLYVCDQGPEGKPGKIGERGKPGEKVECSYSDVYYLSSPFLNFSILNIV